MVTFDLSDGWIPDVDGVASDRSLTPSHCRRREVVVVSLGKYARSYLVPVSFLPRTPNVEVFSSSSIQGRGVFC